MYIHVELMTLTNSKKQMDFIKLRSNGLFKEETLSEEFF